MDILGTSFFIVLQETIDIENPMSTSISHGMPLIKTVTWSFHHDGRLVHPIMASASQWHLETVKQSSLLELDCGETSFESEEREVCWLVEKHSIP